VSILGPSTTLYDLLGVRPGDDPNTIRAAYHRLARRYHPDVDPGERSLRLMIAVNGAYAVLRDPGRRADYDRSLARVSVAQDTWDEERPPIVPPPPVARPEPAAQERDPVLTFGRYAGWTVGRIARTDPDYLEWLARTPAGRLYRNPIEAVMGRSGHAAAHAPHP
jgi:curved DNA-binding protein CbpA